MNNLSLADKNSRPNQCPACLGSGQEMRWMMSRKCRACNGKKKKSNINVEASASLEGVFEPVILRRRGRPPGTGRVQEKNVKSSDAV